MGLYVLVHPFMGLRHEAGEGDPVDLSRSAGLPPLFPSFRLLFVGWSSFRGHLADEPSEPRGLGQDPGEEVRRLVIRPSR